MGGRGDVEADGERVAKVIARAGLASRRTAEAWIAQGRVAVNGEILASPARNVTAADRVTVEGKPLPVRERTRLFLYHKPRGLVTSHADPGGRPTIFSSLPAGLPRLVSVGRLDLNTEGLLLLTNDGGLARTLELPSTGWLRRYRVRAHGRVAQDRLDALRDGVTIDGVHYGPIEARLEREQGSNVWLTFAIREGKNREVKNVLGHLGLAVGRLIRVSFGPFQLGELAEGEVSEVRTRTLREQLGERVAALAGADFAGPRIERRATVEERAPAENAPGRGAPQRTGSDDRGQGRALRDRRSMSAAAVGLQERPKERIKERSKGGAGGGVHRRSRDKRSRRRDPEHVGAPERARQERRQKRRGWRPPRGKER